MNEMIYAQKFVDLINEHDEDELMPLIFGMYLAVAATSMEIGMSEESMTLHLERSVQYCKEKMMDATRH